MKRIFLLLLSPALLLLLALTTNAQTVRQQVKLNELSKKYSSEFQKANELALKRADSLGLPIRLELENDRVVELMRFVNGKPIYATTQNAEGAALINTDELYSGGAAGLSLSGSGQTLALWDAGTVRSTHDELTGRVNLPEGSSVNNHTTHVGGTMIASGVDTDAKGMSPSASLDSYIWDDDQSEMASAASSGLRLSVHPYGYITGWGTIGSDWYWYGDPAETEDYAFGFYDDTYARAWDEIAYNAPNYLIISPSGNNTGEYAPPAVRTAEDYYVYNGSTFEKCSTYSGCNNNYEEDGGANGFDSMSYNSVSKNVMTVGAVDASKNPYSFSGHGPTDDGRIKPDVVAKGVSVYSTTGTGDSDYNTASGTSYSTPMVGGSVGLLLEHQENLHPGEVLLSSTLKALILHTAEDIGNTGPDYTYGWGLMDTQKAAEIMSQNVTDDEIHIKELTLKDGETISVPVQATGSESLRATIAWTDPEGTPPSISIDPTDLMLVNDLDMQLEDESATTFQPFILDPVNPGNNATTGNNFRDNVEIVNVDSPGTNEIYTITIDHKNSLSGGSQDFSLIITGNTGVDYQQDITQGAGEGWRFLSSPVALATYQELLLPLWTQGPDNSDYPAASASESNVRTFDGSSYTSIGDLNTTTDPGEGIAVFVYEDDNYNGSPDSWPKTVTANGMENLEDVNVTSFLNTGSDIFTLLGNPFSSTIDFDNFTNQNQIGPSVYVYDHSYNSGDFRVWNTNTQSGSLQDGLIAPFQGFFVYATGSSPTLTIPTSSTSGTSATFYKDEEISVIQVNAELDEKYTSNTWFTFSESGSAERNINDAPYLYPLDYGPFLTIRSEVNDAGFIIKNLPRVFDQPVEVPVSIIAWQPDKNEQNPGYIPMKGKVVLTWPKFENIPSEWTLTLTDHLTGSIVDLKKSPNYTFTLNDSKNKLLSLPYSMSMNLADNEVTGDSRFTLSIYPQPFSDLGTSDELPSDFTLQQNYPNPFNPSTVIRYSLPEAAHVELDVFTIDGQKVATLVNESKSAGNHVATFQASNLSSGVYIYQLISGNKQLTKKMILVK